jgi:dinuclear metal center YbgI/SA1388 family protein
MPTLDAVTAALENLAPLRLAADWDAVGLLVTPRRPAISRVLACLTLTPAVAAVAVAEESDLVVTHHPLPFRPVARVTPATGTGRVLLDLIGAGCGVWSSHTAWDSAVGGINDLLAERLGLTGIAPLTPDPLDPRSGFGRGGDFPRSLAALADQAAAALGVRPVQLVGDPARPAGRVGIVCGSGGDLVPEVVAAGCDTLLTGEIKLHQAVEADAAGLAVIAVGHHASERFSMDVLAARLAAAVPGLDCRTTAADRDPLVVYPTAMHPPIL